MNTAKGKLYLIPTRLGDNAPLEVLPISIKRIIESVDYYIVENEKTARRFIKKISSNKSQPSLKISILNKFTELTELPRYLDACLEGKNVGLLSEAGCPGIADPGAEIVKIAHLKDIQVVPLVGPSSILLALMASGFNGQSFCFNGYLPKEQRERVKKIKELEKRAKNLQQTQIFIETPYRNANMFEDLLKNCFTTTKLCIAVDITLPTERISTKSIEDWRKIKINLQKRPCIFLIG